MHIETSMTPEGQLIVILKNEELEVWLTDLGASILKILYKDRTGSTMDVVLGYADLPDYVRYKGYLGATIGRTANRIRQGQFVLDSQVYQLPINNGPNTNHGGDGISFRTFSTVIGTDCVLFYLVSPDQDQGYPGNMTITVKYTLKGSALHIHTSAMSDADTLCNLTNHTYFNLDGKPSWIGNHLLQIKSDRYGPVDEDGLVTGELRNVQGTPFDFRKEKRVEDALGSHHPQIRTAKGLDHPFLFSDTEEQIVLYSPATGIQLTITTNMPLAQVYSANYLNGEPGKAGTTLEKQTGICFETQYMADEINLNPCQPQTLLKKGEVWEGETTFQFEIRS